MNKKGHHKKDINKQSLDVGGSEVEAVEITEHTDNGER